MLRKEELTRAISQNMQVRQMRAELMERIGRSINDVEQQIVQLGEQDRKEAGIVDSMMKTNEDLRQKLAEVERELFVQTSKAMRLEEELRAQVEKYQQLTNVYQKRRYSDCYMDAEPLHDEQEQESKERMIPMSTVISFSTTRSTQESVQTLADLLFFALSDRTPDEEKAIKKMIADYKKSMRPQVNATDSTQNFYL